VRRSVPIVVGGVITQVVITNPGYGYDLASFAVTFTDTDGVPGSGATATANRNSGKVTRVDVTAGGRDYITAPSVSFTGGGGTGAAATAVLDTTGTTRDLTITGTYDGPSDTTCTIAVVTGSVGGTDGFADAVVRVTDSTGIDQVQEYTIVQGTEYDLGTFGLKFSFPASLSTPTQGGLLKGDAYFIHAVSEKATGSPAILVLSGQAADTTTWIEADLDTNLLNIDLRTVFTGEVLLKGDPNDAPERQWEAGNASVGGILVRHDLKINVPDRDSGRLRQRRHGRVPRGRGAELLLPRNEHSAPGRASGDRDGHGHRSRPRAAQDRRR